MKSGHKSLTDSVITRQNVILFIAAVMFIGSLIYTGIAPGVSWTAGSALSILLLGLILWAFEPIPFGMTSM
ncbi:hypothetical protein K6L05_11485, partial [Salinicoccus roseus]|nr:hypothetical protein [Salinicoccus roseus]